MIVGQLAILKTGAAYVPLDPDYPQERLAFMVHDADIALLITHEQLANRFSTQKAKVIRLDSEREAIAQESSENPSITMQSEHLAYVIYTSGSTGRPKGVQISHKAVVNFLTSMRQQPGICEKDALLALTSLSFDIAGLEIFLPLLVGARLEIASREEATDGIQLVRRLETSGITMLQATPTSWRMMLEAGWPGHPGMKMLCGGETLPPDLGHRLLQTGASLWNLYGPTETTIWSMIHHVVSVDGPVSIGHPIANTQVYLLDAQLNPVPIGVPGELYLGGDGLSQGYLHRPDLTAERFLPDPFSTTTEMRLYKTGDLARYLPDGTIAFLGRNDHQVKIRGFRIELQEIEVVLHRHPLVKEAVVVAREDEGTDMRLVAYVVPQEKGEGSEAGEISGREKLKSLELRQYLQERLPIYMVPAVFVLLEILPCTPNGKLDRRALPPPDQGQSERENEYEGPRTPIEELLVQIWVQVLRLEQVSVHDNFFELGGHSLLATQLLARVRDTFQVEFPLRRLFAAPTVAAMAQSIAQRQNEQVDMHVNVIHRIEPDNEEHLLERLDQLSDEEMGALLDMMLAEEEIEG